MMIAQIRLLAVFGMLALTARSQTAIYWNFGGGSGAPTTLSANVSVPVNLFGNNEQPGNNPLFNSVNSSSGYTGINGPASGVHNASIGVVTGPLDPVTSTYFEFTVAPATGYSLLATDLQVGTFSNGNGPQTLTLLASTDGFATFTTLGSVTALPTTSTWTLVTLSTFTYSAATDVPVAFRLYGSDGLGGVTASNWRIDDLTFGITAAVPEPSTYATLLFGVLVLGARTLCRRKFAVA